MIRVVIGVVSHIVTRAASSGVAAAGFALAVALVFGSAACNRRASSTQDSQQSAAGAMRIRFGDLINVDVRDVPLLMAFDDLAARGYTIEKVYLSNSAVTTDLLVRGDVDIAMINNQTVWTAIAKGAGLRTIGPFTATTGVMAVSANIRSCQDLDGRSVGAPGSAGLSPMLFQTYLARHCPGVQPQLVVMPESGARADALLTRRLDAAMLPSEELLKLQRGAAVPLRSLYSYAAEFPDVQAEGLHVRRDWAAQHTTAVRDFLRAQLLAYRRINADPQLLFAESAKRLSIDAATAAAVGQSHLDMHIWDGNGLLTTENVQSTIDFLIKANVLAAGTQASQVADFSYLDAVLADIGRLPGPFDGDDSTGRAVTGTRAHRWLLRVASAVVLILAWQLLAWWVHGLLFPSFTQTAAAFGQLLTLPQFWSALWVSHEALLIGFVTAAVCGIAAGLIMGRWPAADAFVDPYLAILLVTPMSALIPIVILALGLKLLARTVVVVVFSIAVVAVNTRTGVRTLQSGWLEMARSFGASERQIWQTIVLPGALPAIMTGLRLGLGRAFTGMVAVELLLVAVGIGRLILEYQGMFESGAVYAVILFMVIEAVVLLRLLRRVERRLAPWAGLVATE